MTFRLLPAAALLLFLAASAPGAEPAPTPSATPSPAATPTPTPRPGLVSRMLHPFHHPSNGVKKTTTPADKTNTHNVAGRIEVGPLPVKLSETRQVKVTLIVTNHTKKLVHLEFPTTQRIEVLVHDAKGKQLAQWSEDQSFDDEQTFVAINPNERVEYSVNVPTRDMTAGEPCEIEAFVPSYKDIKASTTVTPEK